MGLLALVALQARKVTFRPAATTGAETEIGTGRGTREAPGHGLGLPARTPDPGLDLDLDRQLLVHAPTHLVLARLLMRPAMLGVAALAVCQPSHLEAPLGLQLMSVLPPLLAVVVVSAQIS